MGAINVEQKIIQMKKEKEFLEQENDMLEKRNIKLKNENQIIKHEIVKLDFIYKLDRIIIGIISLIALIFIFY